MLRTYSGDIKDAKKDTPESIGSAYSINTVVDDTPIELNVKVLDSLTKVVFLPCMKKFIGILK